MIERSSVFTGLAVVFFFSFLFFFFLFFISVSISFCVVEGVWQRCVWGGASSLASPDLLSPILLTFILFPCVVSVCVVFFVLSFSLSLLFWRKILSFVNLVLPPPFKKHLKSTQ